MDMITFTNASGLKNRGIVLEETEDGYIVFWDRFTDLINTLGLREKSKEATERMLGPREGYVIKKPALTVESLPPNLIFWSDKRLIMMHLQAIREKKNE